MTDQTVPERPPAAPGTPEAPGRGPERPAAPPAGAAPPADPVLRVQGLVKRYRGRTAVGGITFSVASGERVALVGPNGAGKTTTLMSCLEAIRPDAGVIEVLGQTTGRARRAALARVGFAAGYLPLPARIRVIEYLTMYGRLYGSADPGALATAGLRRFGIEDLARRMGTELSSGQRTLVGIVKATMHSPSLLILDEPTASLDPEVALRVRAGLLDLCRAKTTALLVTSHNMAEVEQLAERMIFILGGRLVADGSPAAITAQLGHASLEEVYLQLSGSAPEPEAARSGA